VEDQVTEGDRVASRWVAEGHNRGRPIRIWGIVISRIEDGEIVEDWAASDGLDVVRQLGPWRTLLLGVAALRSRRAQAEQR
jgi:predicted ester cyclase